MLQIDEWQITNGMTLLYSVSNVQGPVVPEVGWEVDSGAGPAPTISFPEA